MSVRALVHAPAQAARGSVVEIRASIAHPMETGYRRGGDGEMLPRDLVRRVEAHFDGQPVMQAELHAAISANPYIAFWLRVTGSGTLVLRWSGDRGFAHEERVAITAT